MQSTAPVENGRILYNVFCAFGILLNFAFGYEKDIAGIGTPPNFRVSQTLNKQQLGVFTDCRYPQNSVIALALKMPYFRF